MAGTANQDDVQDGRGARVLRTYMSPVYFRVPGNPQGDHYELVEFQKDTAEQKETAKAQGPARRKTVKARNAETKPARDERRREDRNGTEQVCLLDELLGGGIRIPNSVLQPGGEGKSPGLFVLLAGPPGSGKSTFALELCYRLSTSPNPGLYERPRTSLDSLYFSAESTTQEIIQQAHSLKWDTSRIVSHASDRTANSQDAFVFVCGRENRRSGIGDEPAGGEPVEPVKFFREVREVYDGFRSKNATRRPDVVVFDSLNVLSGQTTAEYMLESLIETSLREPLLMIAILDTHRQERKQYDRWEHLSDISIYLGYTETEDYMVREMQIVKARYQDHADGTHRLKLNPKPPEGRVVLHPMSPFIKEGGIFVFPSVHRSLSAARREADRNTYRLDEPVPTPFENFNSIIQSGGFPRGSCTAIVGSRGGMKSHLAYYTLLQFLRDRPDERALLISLRDPEEAAKETLAQILTNQRDSNDKTLDESIRKEAEAKELLRQYLNDDRLEILFFWPGYISPEEFFHLVRVAVDRNPGGKKPVSFVVVNGLEQLSARFPLCAKEKMFVSGLVTLLCVKGTTNVVVSGGDTSAPAEQGGVPAGLLQMADLVIESSFRLLPKNRVWSDEVWKSDGKPQRWEDLLVRKQFQRQGGPPEEEPHVVYQVIREPGARECRRRALFYMGRSDDGALIHDGSVYVQLLPDYFPYGMKM